MKIWLSLTLALLFAPVQLVQAQRPRRRAVGWGGERPFAKLFGKKFQFLRHRRHENGRDAGRSAPLMSIVCKMAMRDGSVRTDMDMGSSSGTSLPAQAMAQMKLMGMDHMINLVRKDRGLVYLIYPGMKAYLEMPLSKYNGQHHQRRAPDHQNSFGQ